MARQKLITLYPGSLLIGSCVRLAGGGKVCVYGEGMETGCLNDCRYASVPGPGTIITRGEYSVQGFLVDFETGTPLKAKVVSFIMPTRKRYRTTTNSRGKFKIVVPPDPRAGSETGFRFSLDFGRMDSTPDAKEVVLFGEFTEEFKRTYPHVKVVRLSVANFNGQTLEMGR